MLKNKRAQKGGAVGLAVAGALVAALAIAPASGAYFSAAGAGTANLNTATLKLSFGGQQTFNVLFDNVKPGDRVYKTFTVSNEGSIPANATFHVRDLAVTQGTLPQDVSALSYHIEGSNPAKVVAGTGDPNIDLGVIGAGQSRTYELYIELDGEKAGNEWQGLKLVSNLDVRLDQQR